MDQILVMLILGKVKGVRKYEKEDNIKKYSYNINNLKCICNVFIIKTR